MTSAASLPGGEGALAIGDKISVTSNYSVYSVVSIAPPFATTFTE